MSYRNPQIIVDRSAEIFAQASAQFGQSMVQGVQNYFTSRKEEAARIKKNKEGYQLALNDITLQYNKELNSATKGIKDSSLFQDVQNQARKKLNGGDGELGIIEMQTQLKINPNLDKETRLKYTNSISDYQNWQANIIDKAGAVIVDIEPLKGLNPGNIGKGYDFAGTGNEKFTNMVVANTLDNKTFSGISASKKLNGSILGVDFTINTKDPKIQQYIKSGILNVDELDVDENGQANIKWERDVNKWEGGLIVEVPSDFDGVKALKTSGILGDNGVPKEGLFTETKDVITNIKGTNQQRISTKKYFDPDVLKTNPTFQAEVEAFASGLIALPVDQTLVGIKNNLNKSYTTEQWLSKTADEQKAELMNLITEREIERLVPNFNTEPSGVEGEVNYFVESKPTMKTKPDVSTASDKPTATEKTEEFVTKRAENIVNDILNENKRLSTIRKVIGPDQATETKNEKGEVIITLYPGDKDNEDKFNMNRSEDISRLTKALDESEFGADATTDKVKFKIDEYLKSRAEKRKLP